MPEYAELHASCHEINGAGHGHTWSTVWVNCDWSLPSSLGAAGANAATSAEKDGYGNWIRLPRTEAWSSYEILARHRGKEVCIALRRLSASPPGTHVALPQRRAAPCPTCSACQAEAERPKCRHGQLCVRMTVRKAGPNRGRPYWACGRSGRQQCSTFQWAKIEADDEAHDWFPPEHSPPGHTSGAATLSPLPAVASEPVAAPEVAPEVGDAKEARGGGFTQCVKPEVLVASAAPALSEATPAASKPPQPASQPASQPEWLEEPLLLLTLRRGMHGRVCLLPKGTDPPDGTHLLFRRADGGEAGGIRTHAIAALLACTTA